MTTRYLACDLGAESGRLMLGALNKGKLLLTELHRFPNTPVQDGDSLLWNIPRLYQELLAGLQKAAARQDTIFSVSCDSWGLDYLLFDSDGALLSPTYHYRDARNNEAADEVRKKIPWETLFAETGIQFMPMNTIFQLAAEKSKRLRKTDKLLLIGDGFNFLLSGVAKAEVSLASTTQLYNPRTKKWSDPLIEKLKLPRQIFPEIVPSGTVLGPMKAEVAKETGLEDVKVVATCSHDTAAAVAAVPAEGKNWAYLSSGTWSLMGVELNEPIINDQCRELNFTNEIGHGGTVRLLKNISGLWILQECRRHWAKTEQDYDYEMMSHLAASAAPFESLINPADPRFLAPGDLPAKVQAFCKETGQNVPKKPGPIARCVLESLALLYRHTLRQIEQLIGRKLERLHIVGGGAKNDLLNNFTACATQVPVHIGPVEATAIGNILVQAIAMGHLPSLEAARKVVRDSTPIQVIPALAASGWKEAYAQFEKLLQRPKT